MKKTLILGTNSNIGNKEIIDASRSMGVSTVMTDYYSPEDNPLKLYADEYWDISTADIDALEEKCRAEGVTGIFGGTDYAQDVALELSERLGLPHYCDKASWRFSRDKVAFKAMCRKHGVPVAEDAVISAGDRAASSPIGYPIVVKPSDQSGGVGISYCYSDADYAPAVEKALAKSENEQILAERMLTRKEYHSLYVLKNGEARLLCLAVMLTQPETPRNYIAVTSTAIEPIILTKYLEEVDPNIVKMLADMGCRDGVAWFEVMLNEQNDFCVLEMGHRLSGEMLWMPLKDLTGFDAAQWMAHCAAYGDNDDLAMPASQSELFQTCACAYKLWTYKSGVVAKIDGCNRVKDEIKATVHITTPKGRHFDVGQYPVITAFTAADCEEICRKIRFVNECVSMVDEAGVDPLIRFNDFETLQSMHLTVMS